MHSVHDIFDPLTVYPPLESGPAFSKVYAFINPPEADTADKSAVGQVLRLNFDDRASVGDNHSAHYYFAISQRIHLAE